VYASFVFALALRFDQPQPTGKNYRPYRPTIPILGRVIWNVDYQLLMVLEFGATVWMDFGLYRSDVKHQPSEDDNTNQSQKASSIEQPSTGLTVVNGSARAVWIEISNHWIYRSRIVTSKANLIITGSAATSQVNRQQHPPV
jgi:hypothetical protein